MVDRRQLEVMCVQKIKWKGDVARALARGYKMTHAGGDGRSTGVCIIITEEIRRDVVK